jgi:tRNA (guanine-N7-)-methyltransferase
VTKRKLQRFAEVKTFPHFFEPLMDEVVSGFHLRGKWAEAHFHNNHPLVLELGCGKGEYTVGLGKQNPLMNFIGIDIKGARMWRGAKTALENHMPNVAFLRTQVGLVRNCFAEGEVDEIWITFPDPHPSMRSANKRLTSERFLRFYSGVLKKEGIIHLKTDDDGLYEYTLEVIGQNAHRLLLNTGDLYVEFPLEPVASIQTFYEQMWLDAGKKIKYIRFQL